jgi:asparagine synthase (glutamine-hydrolysing)
MCAIFGIIGKSDPSLLNKISNTQIFRGPDSQELYFDKDGLFCFGNNRLEVIDKSGGKQPMFSEDKNNLVVFNGAIYNFKEIKKYLQSKNISFSTNSDTEVVANSYMHWGEEMFNYLDGMWALSIYDKIKEQIILSRDYVGQKPLFYLKKEKEIIFSSQIKGLSVDQDHKLEINKENLKKFFIYSYLPAPFTLYKDVYQVEAGENISINLRSLQIKKKKYWNLEDGPDYNLFFKKNSDKEFKNIFSKTIKQHTIADKTPAVLLSGGLDSFLVSREIHQNFNNLKSFSIGFQNPTYDETSTIKKLNLNFKKNIYYPNTEDYSYFFNKISKMIDEPIGDSSLLPTFIVFDKVKKHTNVSIGGDGGDENFFGYITFDAFYLALKIKKFVPRVLFKIISKILKVIPNSSNYMSLSFKLKKFFQSINYKKKYINTFWLSPLTLNELESYFKEKINLEKILPELDELFSKKKTNIKLCQLYYFKYYLPMVLSKVDKASMFNSVESRSPFLGKNIINFSLDPDFEKNYKFLKNKNFIKKIFSKEIPSIIKNKKKHGFALPLSEFFKDKKNIYKYLEKKYIYNESFFESKLDLAKNGDPNAQKYIWNELILNLSIQNNNV